MTGAADWTPDVRDVGAMLRARTKDTNGNEVGTFTELTRPTNDQVENLIIQSQDMLTGEFGGDNILPEYQRTARQLAVLRTAMTVELGYYPEQVATNRSSYQQMYDDYTAQLKRLLTRKILVTSSTSYDTGDPSYSFPRTPRPVGLRTEW